MFRGKDFNLRCFDRAVVSTRLPWLAKPGRRPEDRNEAPVAGFGILPGTHEPLAPGPSDMPPVLYATHSPSDDEGFGIGR